LEGKGAYQVGDINQQ
jgi:hypothetical protein